MTQYKVTGCALVPHQVEIIVGATSPEAASELALSLFTGSPKSRYIVANSEDTAAAFDFLPTEAVEMPLSEPGYPPLPVGWIYMGKPEASWGFGIGPTRELAAWNPAWNSGWDMTLPWSAANPTHHYAVQEGTITHELMARLFTARNSLVKAETDPADSPG